MSHSGECPPGKRIPPRLSSIQVKTVEENGEIDLFSCNKDAIIIAIKLFTEGAVYDKN